MNYDFDVAVIGGGPGGYVAAISAAQQGKKTCIVEQNSLGGTCLNVGCIPTKALIKGANVYQQVCNAQRFGVEGVDTAKVTINMEKLQSWKDGVVKQLVNGVKSLLGGNYVTIFNGSASFSDEHTLAVGDQTVSAEYIIIATGSKVAIPDFIAQEGENHIVTSNELLSISTLPQSIVIIGGGVIGVEFAYLLNKLGIKVTVLELMDHILPMVDREISEKAQIRMTRDGVTFHLGAKVQKICNNHVTFELEGKTHKVSADLVLMAVGRKPNTEGLNARAIGLEFDRAAIKSDDTLRTNLSHIFAIGDVNGKAMLAHTASVEAEVAVSCICGVEQRMDYRRIPSCIYLEPEIACVGLTEAQARTEYGEHVKVGTFPAYANGRSLVEGDSDGMFKIILDSQYGEILGAHFYGQHTTEMIAEIAAAMRAEATAEELISSIHPHPTVSESIREAVLAAWTGKAIHNL